MIDIDTRLEKAIVLPGSFIPVLGSIETVTPCGLSRYVEYLLDDSIVPTTVRKTFQPEGIAPDQDWQSIVPYYKQLLFRQGLLDSTSRPVAVDDYREHPFDRLAELRQEPYSACRLQIKDDILRELVRAYIEGQLAGSEARAEGQPGATAQFVDDYSTKGCVNTRVKKRLFSSVGSSPLITFFMLVTDRDVLIADHAISSYQLLKNLDFKLVVYCNWISPENRSKYFDKWRSLYPFLEILVPEWMTEATRPAACQDYGYGVEGPYERCEVPWDRELPLLESEYYATVDADFEILSPAFIGIMSNALVNSDAVGFVGTDRNNNSVFSDREHPGKNILHARIHTWCCFYRRATSACGVSHMFYHEPAEADGIVQNVWDSSAIRQMALGRIHGYSGLSLPPNYSNQFIHYVAFSKNKHLDESNIGMYRQLMILGHIGHAHILEQKIFLEYRKQLQGLLNKLMVPYADSADVSELAKTAYARLFSHVDQSNPYKNGEFDWHE